MLAAADTQHTEQPPAASGGAPQHTEQAQLVSGGAPQHTKQAQLVSGGAPVLAAADTQHAEQAQLVSGGALALAAAHAHRPAASDDFAPPRSVRSRGCMQCMKACLEHLSFECPGQLLAHCACLTLVVAAALIQVPLSEHCRPALLQAAIGGHGCNLPSGVATCG